MTSEANLDTARAKQETAQAAVKRIEAVIAQKAIAAPFSGRARHPQGGEGTVCVGRHGAGRRCRRSIPSAPTSRCPSSTSASCAWASRSSSPSTRIPGQVFKGEIQSLDARVAQDTRTLLVRAILPNKERKLLPGMFANVTVLVGEAADVVTVPRTAVTYSLYGDSVYVVKPAPAAEGGKRSRRQRAGRPSEPLIAERRFVRTGQVRDDRVAVTFGLTAGEQVVTTGQLKLNPGAAIHIDNTQPLNRPETRPKL